MKFKEKFVKTMFNVSKTVGKHSPLLLTIAGVAGLGATAVFSYKASKKVEAIVEDVEEKRSNDEEVDRVEVAKQLTGALALPVLTGVASVAAISFSYHIQHNRILGLASALASATAEQAFYKAKYKKVHGEEAAKEFYTPGKQVTHVTTNEEGEEESQVETMRKELPGLHGQWFDKSTEYASDDHEYNMQFIRITGEQLNMRLFGKGWLRMNEVNEELGFERTRSGELMGWSSDVPFDLDTTVTLVKDPKTGELKPQIYVKWPTPQYIYDQIDYEEKPF